MSDPDGTGLPETDLLERLESPGGEPPPENTAQGTDRLTEEQRLGSQGLCFQILPDPE